MIFGASDKKPDFIIYIAKNGFKPQWFIVESKESVGNFDAVKQINAGIQKMTENPNLFGVVPKPKTLLGVIAHKHKRIRIS